jgi:hypothetical protein
VGRRGLQSKAISNANYRTEKEEYIKELGVHATKLVHPSGATLLHLDKDDTKTFSVGFKTFPRNSTGIPHILEHLSLCGSEKYPVRDPFFKMLSRSLASYMNAWTAADWTMYPFATQNRRDFTNLRDVYLDAVFGAQLKEQDFRQEGWRLEYDQERWSLTGVVYNEMKGVFSDGESLFGMRHQQEMFPGTTYGVVSGGDPADIPKLDHKTLEQFYELHYRPANSLLFSYGNVDVSEHLDYLNEILLQKKQLDPASLIGDAMDGFIPYNAPRRVIAFGGADPGNGDIKKQTKMIISFLANDAADAQATFNMRILSSLLLDGPAAPFHQALLDSNIGSEYAPGTGYDTSTRQRSFSVGLQGISEDDVDRVEELIMGTLREVRKTGFPPDRIEALLHQVDLGLRCHNADFGLGLAQRATKSWTHGACPLEDLKIAERVDKFREMLRGGGLFEGLIDGLLQTLHRLTFIMKPDPRFAERNRQTEDSLVATQIGKLSKEELEGIRRENELLRTEQDRLVNTNLLPCLDLADVCKTAGDSPYRREDHRADRGGYQYTRITPKANGLGYFTLKLPLSELESSDIRLLPLLSACWMELGTTDMGAADFDRAVRNACSGLSMSFQPGKTDLSLLLSSHALPHNVPKMFDLFAEALTRTNWQDEARIKSNLLALASSSANSIVSSGSSFAVSMAASDVNHYRRVRELMSGLEQVSFLEDLVRDMDITELTGRLKRLASVVLDGVKWDRHRIAFIDDSDKVRPILRAGARTLTERLAAVKNNLDVKPLVDQYAPKVQPSKLRKRQAKQLPISTNFVAMVAAVPPRNWNRSANLSVLAKLLGPLYLHREIREKGGAYGGSASFSLIDGLFSMSSYRDPDPVRTIAIMKGVSEWLEKADITSQNLLEAKLAVISEWDAPRDVANEGLQHFSHDFRDIDRQVLRDSVLDATVDSVKDVARQILGKMRCAVLAEDTEEMSAKLAREHLTVS